MCSLLFLFASEHLADIEHGKIADRDQARRDRNEILEEFTGLSYETLQKKKPKWIALLD